MSILRNEGIAIFLCGISILIILYPFIQHIKTSKQIRNKELKLLALMIAINLASIIIGSYISTLCPLPNIGN
jgi:uncharacterized membrane protein YidH (DUF202 family)